MKTPKILHRTAPRISTLVSCGAIKNHDPAATAAARAATGKVTAKATSQKTLVDLALKILKPHESRGLSHEVLVKRGFAVRLAGGEKCKGMTHASILERAHEVRSNNGGKYGGKGGDAFDDWNKVVAALMLKRDLSWEEAEAELDKVQGAKRTDICSCARAKAGGSKEELPTMTGTRWSPR